MATPASWRTTVCSPWERSFDGAISLAADVEWLAGVYRRAVTLGEPVVLPDDEMARVAELFEGYGQPR